MTHPLRKWRKDNGVGLDVLAEKTGVQASHLSMIERGLRGVSMELAAKLSSETSGEVPLDAFIRDAA